MSENLLFAYTIISSLLCATYLVKEIIRGIDQ